MQNDLENIFYTAFEDNKDRIFRICRSYARDHDQSQDIFQEVLMNIWKSLPSFRAQSHINTWVYRITINTCLKAIAFNEKRKKQFRPLRGLHMPDPVDPLTGEDDENFRMMQDCMDQLSHGDRSVLLLFLEDLAYKQIAEVTGMTENHVAVKLKRIKEKLSNCIKIKNHERE